MTGTYKIRGNGDPTLPIEDWAKGIRRAFSRRRKSHSVNSINLEQSTQMSMVSAVPSEYRSDLLLQKPESSVTTLSPLSRPRTSVTLPHEPIEDWRKVQKPIPQPRNPRRNPLFVASTITQPSLLTTECSTSTSSSPSSLHVKTIWQSDTGSERVIPNQVHHNQLDQYVNTTSETPASSEAQLTQNVMPSSSSIQDPQGQLCSSESIMRVEKLSLRSLFFGGTQIPRDRPPRLSIISSGPSNYARPQSAASSTISFVTADEFTTKDNKQIMDTLTVECVMERQAKYEIPDTGTQQEISATSRFLPQADTDTVVDEDYRTHEQEIVETRDKVAAESGPNITDPAGDQTAVKYSVPGDGSLAAILFQIAASSPYVSSDSEDASSLEDASTLDQAEVSSQSDLEEDVRFDSIRNSYSDKSVGVSNTDTQRAMIFTPNRSVPKIALMQPTQNYKMVNGRIIAFEPWRIPSQFDLSRYSPPLSKNSDTASFISGSSSRLTGSFP